LGKLRFIPHAFQVIVMVLCATYELIELIYYSELEGFAAKMYAIKKTGKHQ